MADKKKEETPPVGAPLLKEYNPRHDPGPERPEDEEASAADKTPLSAKEVPLEKSRKDDTSILATDLVRVGDGGEVEIVK
jgi:hypothetical protein